MCKLLVVSFWTRILVQTSKSPLQEIKTYDPELTWSSCVSAPSSSGTGSTAVCRSCSMRRVWRLHNWENRLQQSIAYLFFEWNVTSCYAASTHTYMNTELKNPFHLLSCSFKTCIKECTNLIIFCATKGWRLVKWADMLAKAARQLVCKYLSCYEIYV